MRSADDWARKTAALRNLEERVREIVDSGEPMTHRDLAAIPRILRKAVAETPSDSLPIDVELIGLIADCLDGSVRPPRGRPRNDGRELERQLYRAVDLAIEVHDRHRQLQAARAKAPKDRAIREVAKAHNMEAGTLKKLLKRGPTGVELPAWKREKLRVLKGG
jgi:hypothetical protein